VTTGQLAAKLGVSRSAILKWHAAGLIEQELTTPGGHLRWDVDAVRAHLKEQRQRAD
jgi:DNA-binding transcriptional MerR regulator